MKKVLAVEVKRNGQPKTTWEAINSLLRWVSLNAGAIGFSWPPTFHRERRKSAARR